MAAAPRKTPPAAKPAAEVPTIEDLVTEAETEAVSETPEQARIRELQAALLAEDEKKHDEDGMVVRPAPALTPEEKMIRDLEDQLAKKKAANITTAFEEASGDYVHIHFIRDGFTACGEVWYRGQEIKFDKAGEAYANTLDRNGDSWLDLADNTGGQYARWGEEYFRSGPFIGRKGEVFDDAIAQADKRRGTAAPITRL
jgi:hypothetical protein